MKFKIKVKILIFAFFIILTLIPSSLYGVVATNVIAPTNYSNNVDDLFEEVKDGVVMINNISGNSLSAGTGMIYKEDENYLYLMSNYHVVENTTALYSYFYNGEIKETYIIGYDEYMDVAVLYCRKPTQYKVLEYANSNYCKEGEEIIAIGNPVSSMLEYSTTKGIIAKVGIEISSKNFYLDQHLTMIDIALNPGNSGGPSFNIYGQVVGINSLKYTYDGQNYYEGMNFMIPISEALNVAMRIEQHKNHVFVRPFFGENSFFNVHEFTIFEREKLKIPNEITSGVFVYETKEENNSLLVAGVTNNCIIISLANENVKNIVDLRRVLYSLNVYQKVEIKYVDLNDNNELKTSLVAINSLVIR